MLALRRKRGDSILIRGGVGGGLDVKITVLEISMGQVRLGVEADPSIIVNLAEVARRIERDKQAIADAEHAARRAAFRDRLYGLDAGPEGGAA